MKVNGPMHETRGRDGCMPTAPHEAAIQRQNGKKSRGIRAANLRGQASKRQRRMMARHG